MALKTILARRKSFRALRTITLAELREAVEDAIAAHGAEALAVFTTNYGDYSNTMQALGLDGNYEERALEETAYSATGFALSEDDGSCDDDCPEDCDGGHDDEALPKVVVFT